MSSTDIVENIMEQLTEIETPNGPMEEQEAIREPDPIYSLEDHLDKLLNVTDVSPQSTNLHLERERLSVLEESQFSMNIKGSKVAEPRTSNITSLMSLKKELKSDGYDFFNAAPDTCSIAHHFGEKPSKSILESGFGIRNVESLQDALKDAGHDVASHVSVDQDSCPCSSSESTISDDGAKMLVKGFGIRNIDSLERVLLDDEERRKALEEKYGKASGSEYECESLKSWPSKCSSRSSDRGSLASAGQKSLHRRQLEYLLGIDVIPEEFEVKKPSIAGLLESIEGEAESTIEDEATTLAMRRAQRYLRTHKIFEFFQFLIAHLLSALPENPVEFLLNLLDSCLMYRSGLGNPPLLFEIRHLVELFYLMDRMRTGFIEPEQYETGMVTLGICSYNKNPPLSPDGMVAKETFIEEAYECLCDLLSDMIRRRGPPLTPTKSTPLLTPPPSFADFILGSQPSLEQE